MAPFARNRLCALARAGLDAGTGTVVALMLDPAAKLDALMPGDDLAIDCAGEVFRKVNALRPGSFAVLDGKAPRLTGEPASVSPPEGRCPYAAAIKAIGAVPGATTSPAPCCRHTGRRS